MRSEVKRREREERDDEMMMSFDTRTEKGGGGMTLFEGTLLSSCPPVHPLTLP